MEAVELAELVVVVVVVVQEEEDEAGSSRQTHPNIGHTPANDTHTAGTGSTKGLSRHMSSQKCK